MTEKSKTSGRGGRGCSSYDERQILRYLDKSMTYAEVKDFEAHAETCDQCLKGVYRCHVELEGRKDEEFAKRSITLHHAFAESKAANLLQIAVRSYGKLVEVLSTTGDLLMTPACVQVRGKTATNEKVEPIRVVENFSTPPISLQVTLERVSDERGMLLKISVYDRRREEFLPDIDVQVTGAEQMRTMTDADGEAAVRIEVPGPYSVQLNSGESRIGQISITAEMD